MKVYSLYILNKAGGLIYQNDIHPELNKLSANDYLVLAGTLHGVHAIASNLGPSIQKTGINPTSGGLSVGSQLTTLSSEHSTSGGSIGANNNSSSIVSPLAANSSIIATGKSQNPNSNRSGLQSVETDFFNLYVFQSLTGIKFIIITSPNTVVHNVQAAPAGELGDQLKHTNKGELLKQCNLASDLFKQIYVLYGDYVMKNPFYSLDMPIKCSLFDLHVNELVK